MIGSLFQHSPIGLSVTTGQFGTFFAEYVGPTSSEHPYPRGVGPAVEREKAGMDMVSQFAKYGAVFAAGALTFGGGIALGMVLDGPRVITQQASSQVSEATTSVSPSPGESSGLDSPQEAPDVISIGALQKNTMVTVQGVVQRISDEDEFVIADETGSVKVSTGNQFFTVEQGEWVIVEGFVDDDLILEIYAQQITREDGTEVTISSSE